MKGTPIHQNLSTSFTDVTALVRHLNDLQFTGSLRVEFSSYEAEVIFTGEGTVRAREYDRLTGRIAQGERAFNRILKRAREPLGRVHVVQAAAKETVEYFSKPFVDERIVAAARVAAFDGDRLGRSGTVTLRPMVAVQDETSGEAVELATELLLTLKDAFDRSRLNFERAFANACEIAARDFKYLDARRGLFAFRSGRIIASEQVSTDELFVGIVEALRHLLVRLRMQAKFAKLLAFSRHRIQQHISSRHTDYERLGLTDAVDRLFI